MIERQLSQKLKLRLVRKLCHQSISSYLTSLGPSGVGSSLRKFWRTYFIEQADRLHNEVILRVDVGA